MRKSPLLRQTLAIYLLVIVLGTLLLIAKNVWVHDLRLADLAEYFFGAMAVLNIVFLSLMQLISYVRLRGVHRYFQGRTLFPQPDRLSGRLFRFPTELFWSMIVLSAILSVAYHGAYMLFMESSDTWNDLLSSFLSEQALAVTLAVMVYSLLRSALRPYLQQLQQSGMGGARRMSAIRPLMLCYISCFVIISLDVLRNLVGVAEQEGDVDVASLASIVIVDFLFSLAVFTLLIRGLRQELREMTDGIRSLSSGSRAQLHGAIRIGFPDEMGQLAEAFNAEQERAARRYDLLEEELALAASVQQVLLPVRECRFGSCSVRAEGTIAEAAGEWYDIVPLDRGRFAVVAGVVLGRDMPAALVMSAALVLLRSEIRRGRAAGDALQQLLSEWMDILPKDMRIHMGVALLDPSRNTAQIAAVGFVGIKVRRQSEDGAAMQCLAVGQEAVQSGSLSLQSGDRMTIAVEAGASDHASLGYKRAEREHTRVSVYYDTG